MKKAEFDSLTWANFPSSLKLTVDEATHYGEVTPVTASKPNSRIRMTIKAKLKDVLYDFSHIALDGWDGSKWFRIEPPPYVPVDLGRGTIDWKTVVLETIIPSNVNLIRPYLVAGGGSPEKPAITWFDDLKIYQDDVLIYENNFSNWAPLIIIPAEIITGVAAIKFIK